MENLKRLRTLKRTDITAQRILKAIWRRIKDVPEKIYWDFPFHFTVKNRAGIEKFKDIHKGKRCFIIANGPSLKKIDFSLLKDDHSIGLNRIYMMKGQNGFMPDYLACVDMQAQLLQFFDDYNNVEIDCFYNWEIRNKFKRSDNQHFVRDKLSPSFSTDLAREGYGTGRSVTYLAIQLAYYMGFSEVYLIGKDHSYNTSEKTGTAIKSDGQEDNHFIKGYYKPGMKWFAPDLETEEYAYRLARTAFENDGRIIKDATIGGKLNVFEKVDYYSLFTK
ncbi:DUF115 domain-containing protein [Mucilaginibacter mali]|uniref:DUF115 domain-containing protein n=1 Tax=Mucilaginibacter mali TaxID=2740462 RepID=A0A7D4QM21_9SPHI|nr:6-hydroxymethylpterin diphosphokinase MptE-like protein [Mucilaginibacter mali]QKJ31470.1 DUF115 domain-containing protein [Mucilaginibacter mali]